MTNSLWQYIFQPIRIRLKIHIRSFKFLFGCIHQQLIPIHIQLTKEASIDPTETITTQEE